MLRAATVLRGADKRIRLAPFTYIAGEEMSHYCMTQIVKKWVDPFCDMSQAQHFDLSCISRDATADKVLHDAVASGAHTCAIFNEPTITPSAEQKKQMGLVNKLPSPNGAMRRGWNGITISRDTIHIEGIELGFDKPVLFDRHAVGGEYGAGWEPCGAGRLVTSFLPNDPTKPATFIDDRALTDQSNVAVVYHNPLDNVADLARIFFDRCLEQKVVPYVVTKKTVFHWQNAFWESMKNTFDIEYRDKFRAAGLLERTDGELTHVISDAATMQIIRWTGGGFGMACHNYDGDMLTDEVAQVHRSPGFITSNLTGKRPDGTLIKEFEASHGTVADLWHSHLRGEETSMNPLGMVEAFCCTIKHASDVAAMAGSEDGANRAEVHEYANNVIRAIHAAFREGSGTRDLCGAAGLTTDGFIDHVAQRLRKSDFEVRKKMVAVPRLHKDTSNVDLGKVDTMFAKYDTDNSGDLSHDEFVSMLMDLNLAPLKDDGLEHAAARKSALEVDDDEPAKK